MAAGASHVEVVEDRLLDRCECHAILLREAAEQLRREAVDRERAETRLDATRLRERRDGDVTRDLVDGAVGGERRDERDVGGERTGEIADQRTRVDRLIPQQPEAEPYLSGKSFGREVAQRSARRALRCAQGSGSLSGR